ncbi:DUF11 domain-containing protein [Clostridium botulinum]|uniref:DUF11 domain-containing protein n=1 Tax=Clostridium botulinum TaxID=1491 RepID=UPI000653C088|nr:DUF11 domain-containing protein [Clostridium botulinum]KOC47588.1 hypothetical protein ADU88_09665 [Clostridium botulinum]KOC55801.1 hypothetical protein ADU90_10015 [Clostridium botulinum]KOC56400.1 hypothetical protein ADU89_02845 [Clostridium botulinum]MCD3234173.1 DUF11 domain-containing protein [Clostridium botulinum D/C]MCD3240010.1 DUF11 domain-containing protein [Clostridium botulinum D/C]
MESINGIQCYTDSSTNEIQCYATSSTSSYYIKVINNGSYNAQFIVGYTNNGSQYSINSGTVSSCSSKTINIPSTATNPTVNIQFNNNGTWVTMYNSAFNGPPVLTVQLTGTVTSPSYTILPPDSGNGSNPTMNVVQTVNPIIATVGQCITVTVAVTNNEGVTANGVNLQLQAPAGSTFIPGSLMIGGVQSNLSEFPTGGIALGNVQEDATVTVVYQVLYNSVPEQANGSLLTAPKITYSFTGSNGSNQVGTLTGTTGTLTVTSGCQPPTCSPCCCCCCCCCPSTSSMYNSYNQCM